MLEFKIANKKIGNKNPCFVVAELSGNHGGSFKRLKDAPYHARFKLTKEYHKHAKAGKYQIFFKTLNKLMKIY